MPTERYPQAAVSVVVREPQTGAFLIVRRGRAPAKDLWAFPGGRVRWGETVSEAAARELREETQLSLDPASLSVVEVVDLIGDETGGEPDHHFVLTVFSAIAHGTAVAGDDAAELRVVTIQQMEALAMTATTLATARRIAAS